MANTILTNALIAKEALIQLENQMVSGQSGASRLRRRVRPEGQRLCRGIFGHHPQAPALYAAHRRRHVDPGFGGRQCVSCPSISRWASIWAAGPAPTAR